MCLLCHSSISDDEMLRSLKETPYPEMFNRWNTTSVSHISLAAAGMNGVEVRNEALLVLDRFLEWYRENKQDGYMPDTGLESMYPVSEITRFIECLKELTDEHVAVAKSAFLHELEELEEGGGDRGGDGAESESNQREKEFLKKYSEFYPTTTVMKQFVTNEQNQNQIQIQNLLGNIGVRFGIYSLSFGIGWGIGRMLLRMIL